MGAKMKIRSSLCVLMLLACILLFNEAQADDRYENNPYFATSSRYDYMYANPPKQSLGAYGRYILSSSKVRYVHSPSRLKGAKHAARINAYNLAAYGY